MAPQRFPNEAAPPRLWFAPALLVYPFLFIAARNPGQVDGKVVATTITVALIAWAILYALLRLRLRSPASAGLATTWLVVLFFSYGPLSTLLIDAGASRLGDRRSIAEWIRESPHLMPSITWLVLGLAGIWLIHRIRVNLANAVAGVLNVASILLLALVTVQLVGAAGAASTDRPRVESVVTAGTGTPRDIYYIVLDGYARADVLQDQYDFDNGPFLAALRRRGFRVAEQSRANYYWTFLSLTSALNLDYLQSLLPGQLGPQSQKRKQAYRLLRDNRVAAFLRERGYRTVHLQSTWSGTAANPYADDFRQCHGGLFSDEYLRALAEVSWLKALGSRASLDLATCHLNNLETLEILGSEPGPKFVFAHFLPPHHPYLFDREGHVLRRATLSDQFEFQKLLWEARRPYVDQLTFVNERILRVIDRLRADSGQEPIIVLQSDHGPNLREGLSEKRQHQIRLANFSACLLPGAPDDLMPDDGTPVNHFRRIFNHYFGTGHPILEDRYFVSPFARPYAFEEVDRNGAWAAESE